MMSDECEGARASSFITHHSAFIIPFMLLFVQLPQRVEHEVRVAERLNADGELVGGLVEVEGSGGDFAEEAEGECAFGVDAFGVDYAAVVEEDGALSLGALDCERARQL